MRFSMSRPAASRMRWVCCGRPLSSGEARLPGRGAALIRLAWPAEEAASLAPARSGEAGCWQRLSLPASRCPEVGVFRASPARPEPILPARLPAGPLLTWVSERLPASPLLTGAPKMAELN